MFWLVALISTTLVILVLLFPAIKNGRTKKIIDSPQETEIQRLKNKINFYKIVCFLTIIPIISFGIYNMIGLPESLQLSEQSLKAKDQNQFNSGKHAEQIEQVLKQDPDNPKLLEQMTKVYMARGDYEKAVEFANKRVESNPENSNALTQLADALAMLKKGNIDAEVMQILDKAISLDSRNPVALTLSGIGHQQKGETASAISQWNVAVTNLPVNSELSARVNELIQDAQKQLTSNQKNTDNEVIARINVKIDPQLIRKIESNSTMFVFLKSTEKAPPLYAIKTKTPKNFPVLIEFTKENSMLGNTNMQKIDLVYAVARISKTGSPIGRTGDIEGKSEIFKPTSDTKIITINRVLDNDR